MNTLEHSLRSLLAEDGRGAPGDGDVVLRVIERTRRRDRGRRVGLTIGLTAAATAAVVLVPDAIGGRDDRPDQSSVGSVESSATDSPSGKTDPTDGPSGPVFGTGAVSCVEEYSPTEVMDRDFAFDGIVTAIGPGHSDRGDESDLGYVGVTFEVQEWFRGGDTATITIDLDPPGGVGYGNDPLYAIGSRLLVSGQHRWDGTTDADLLGWGCGFTRYHDDATAEAWRRAAG